MLRAVGAAQHVGSWAPAPLELSLAERTVHVWRIELAVDENQLNQLEGTLSDEELARAECIRLRDHRVEFVAGRGALRTLLAHYLCISPWAVRFTYGPHGKPSLAPTVTCRTVLFNLSHSKGLALVAVAKDREVGVDVEHVRGDFDYLGSARLALTPHENAFLESAPPNLRVHHFYWLWTCKEAYLKAMGKGLSVEPSDIQIVPLSYPLQAGFGALAGVGDGRDVQLSAWSIETLVPGAGHVGAVAAEGNDWRSQCWRWSDELMH